MLNSYLRRILETAGLGDAREESYYSALEALLVDFSESTNRRDVHVTILPKKTDAGNPDFRIWDGKQRIVGYIEAKKPDKNLDDVEKTEQAKRYMATFPNFILTNFLEFRLYKNSIPATKVRIANPEIIRSLRSAPLAENEKDLESLLEKFFSFSFPKITSAQPLALELAKRTRFLCDEVVAEEIREEEKSGLGKILGFYEAFQRYLVKGLTKEDFADLYSQTITYGLFASRMRCEGKFNRKLAVHDIPHTIGILKELFEFISLGDLPTQLEWIVDEISDVLANVDVKKIFSEYFRNKKGDDPVFHFYETFLEKYDPEEREKRGVYYTPEPVVSYIVRSLHTILKDKFGLDDGLANENVTILDPAGGTLTFIAEAIKQALKEFVSKYGEGGKKDFVRDHILKDFYAFELMVAPYAIGHIKISFLLDELGHRLQDGERVKFYLTNTLELEKIEQTTLPGMASLAEESRKAGDVKKRIPILVILGNPPYSGMSANKGKWITGLIENYKFVDGKPLGEKNPKWLQDDYVKFIRFAEWKITRAGKGVVGFITNHSYLDNPTFRGMRRHLMKSFDEIYILNLHGNTMKKEKCPDGSKDENVFDIRQGVSIAFLVKNKTSRRKECQVFHSEIWGLRKVKYDWLSSKDLNATGWSVIHPNPSSYFFVPREKTHEQLYNKYWKFTEIFIVNSVGIVTARDDLTVRSTPEDVWQTAQDFSSLPVEQARIKYGLGEDCQDWTIPLAQQDLRASGLKREFVVPILYRPFDVRYTYYTGRSRGFICRPRYDVMQHMMRKNVAICVGRAGQVVGLEKPWNIVFCSELMEDFNLFYRGGNVNFPLYLYTNKSKKANIHTILCKNLEKTWGRLKSPEEIFYYVYAILYSNVYRAKYADFLKTDFPRVPFTRDYDLVAKMAKLGKRLVDLHLLKSAELGDVTVKFQGSGENRVENLAYSEKDARIYINKTQYFEGIEREAWEYHIGGYRILSKWLKDRKGNNLSLQDIKHYCGIVAAIKKTIELQNEVDELYPDVENDVVEFEQNSMNNSLKSYT